MAKGFSPGEKGISFLFLIIALLLLTTLAYVLSYLIPIKHKSVIFPLHSLQAFALAQSGLEYGLRYGADQGWRTPLDLVRLNNANVCQRNLGNGRFIIQYDNSTDTLTSAGEITNSFVRRVVALNNFSVFLRLIFASFSPLPCWVTSTQQARFYIQNVQNENVTLTAFSASWIPEPSYAADYQLIYGGDPKSLLAIMNNGRPAVSFNRGGGATNPLAGERYSSDYSME